MERDHLLLYGARIGQQNGMAVVLKGMGLLGRVSGLKKTEQRVAGREGSVKVHEPCQAVDPTLWNNSRPSPTLTALK